MVKIPHTKFSTDQLPEEDRYQAWQESMGVLFDIEKEDKLDSKAFEAHVEAFMYDQLVVGSTASTAAHYTRSTSKLNCDGLDMIMIQLFLEGGMQFGVGRNVATVEKGDMVVFDLGQKATNFDTDNRLLAVIFPREVISEYVPGVDRWHGKTLPRNHPMTHLLRNHLISLFSYGQDVTVDFGASIQRSTLELTASAFRASEENLIRSSDIVAATVLQEIKAHIISQLSQPTLSPESIAVAFGLSRAQLYRVVESLGGIMNYVRQLRLRRCMKELQNATLSHSSISEIGFKWGFNDIRTFNRNFKQAFGITPKDARESGIQLRLSQAPNRDATESVMDRSYEEWLQSQAK